ncbi:hypothetical protein WICPIJ_001105 [Wickerhamomyces pijperi]|uniref:Uncharacterized protein n=1 Tax=Wickerhamomyces pijperi TaxID=599730 RepID=A0A9P8TQ72_WICPI|nr:hypothetical protein WICPIJ_001105 [Wickerhamomyces pijperi]
MEMVSSTLGSLSKIGWNLLERAGSFSMILNSSKVVAEMHLNPLANLGFKMLEASIDPSDFPSPNNM